MALVNDAKREVNAKIVYIGPEGAGKDTALHSLYGSVPVEHRSELKTLASGGHSMLFFDFAYPVAPGQSGYQVRFHVYTLTSDGGDLPWKMLLKGADGVVFLADSLADRLSANLICCATLHDALAHYGIKADSLPLALQCNKRDLPDILPLERLQAELFPETGGEPQPVVALTGQGLWEGLDRLARAILGNLGQTLPVALPAAMGPVARPVPADDEDFAAVADEHCLGPNAGFAIESAGTPECQPGGKIRIPLRLVGGECGKSIDFSVTVAVSLQ